MRSDFNQIIEEEPKSTISAATNIDTVPKPQLTPLPPPVMSAVLVSPKEKKTASTTASPLDGKQFANLQNTRRSTDKIPDANQQQSRISNISSKLTKPSEDLSMTLEIDYDEHLTEPRVFCTENKLPVPNFSMPNVSPGFAANLPHNLPNVDRSNLPQGVRELAMLQHQQMAQVIMVWELVHLRCDRRHQSFYIFLVSESISSNIK